MKNQEMKICMALKYSRIIRKFTQMLHGTGLFAHIWLFHISMLNWRVDYIPNPNNAVLLGNPLKITIDLFRFVVFDPPKSGSHLMTPELVNQITQTLNVWYIYLHLP